MQHPLQLGDERGGDRRGGLDSVAVGVVNQLVLVLRSVDRACGADLDAAAAADAGALCHGFSEGGADGELTAAAGGRQVVHCLHLAADVHTAPALDALVGIADDDRARVYGQGVVLLLEGQHIHLVFPGQRLQLTEAVLHAVAEEAHLAELGVQIVAAGAADAQTMVAVHRVVREQQLQRQLSGGAHRLGVGVDDHALAHPGGAGMLKGAGALHLHHAHAAGGVGIQFFQKAQGRDVDAVCPRGLQDRASGGHGQGLAVDRKIDVCHAHASFFSFASKSSGKSLSALMNAVVALCPRGQKQVFCM